MKLILEIDLDAVTGDRETEVSRILRYWAGGVAQVGLTAETEQTLMDSTYAPVGRLAVTD